MSYVSSTGARRSLTQSIIETHVFVPGICVFDSVLMAFALKFKERVSADQIDVFWDQVVEFGRCRNKVLSSKLRHLVR
jgi:hypothetical protein